MTRIRDTRYKKWFYLSLQITRNKTDSGLEKDSVTRACFPATFICSASIEYSGISDDQINHVYIVCCRSDCKCNLYVTGDQVQ